MKKLAGAVNYRYLLSLLLSILFAFLIGAGILAVSGFHPLEAYGAMLSGAFDSARHIGDFLEYAMVLCVCGLACVLGARVGIFNVGGEGQLLLGAIFAAQVGVWMDGQPRFLVIVCAALAAMAVGGLYAFLPGVLKVKVKVNEVITTIMLNSVATFFCSYMANGPLKTTEKGIASGTASIMKEAGFAKLIPLSNLTTAILFAAVAAFFTWYLMTRSSVGFEMKLTGDNDRFAAYGGISAKKLMLWSMVLSGAICGLCGFLIVAGKDQTIATTSAGGRGFTAIIVAWLAQFNTFVMILISFLLVFLQKGAIQIASQFNLNDYASNIITGIILFFILGSEFFINYRIILRGGKEGAK